MSEELIYPESVSVESLKALFEEYRMETAVDTDGDLVVKDDFRCYLHPDPDGRLIYVYAIFRATETASREAKLEYINKVHDQVNLIRASIGENGKFYFEYFLPVEGGIARRAVVLAVRRFFSCLRAALREDTEDVMQ